MKRLRIGTRGSMLALAQANWVKQQIETKGLEFEVELVMIKTSGDKFTDRALQSFGGKGAFTKEIEEALNRREIDLAVHSMKDLPTDLAPGLAIVAVPAREDPRDVLVSRSSQKVADLPAGSSLGTGSLRRRAQLLHYRRNLDLVPIRGNVDTRLRKLDAGEVDGLIMAAAGLKRIGREERITEYLSDEICVSAVAQGALGLEARAEGTLAEDISFLHDASTYACVSAERAFLRRLGGGCLIPVGARAKLHDGKIAMVGVVAAPDGARLIRDSVTGESGDGEALGTDLADKLLAQGADKILGRS